MKVLEIILTFAAHSMFDTISITFQHMMYFPVQMWRKHKASSIINFHIINQTNQQGACSSVYIAHDKLYNTKVALKVVPLKGENALPLFANEAKIVQLLSGSPNIVKVSNCFVEAGHGFIVMEIGTSDLHSRYIGRQLEVNVIKNLFQQILIGVQSCHRKGIAHLDIKPENILVNDSNDSVALCDFGSAVDVRSIPEYMKTFSFGSALYAAPEIRGREKNVTLAADMWSLGVLLHMLVTGFYPFEGETPSEVYENYMKDNLCFDFLQGANISSVGKNLIRLLLKASPKYRLTIDQAIKHPWFDE